MYNNQEHLNKYDKTKQDIFTAIDSVAKAGADSESFYKSLEAGFDIAKAQNYLMRRLNQFQLDRHLRVIFLLCNFFLSKKAMGEFFHQPKKTDKNGEKRYFGNTSKNSVWGKMMFRNASKNNGWGKISDCIKTFHPCQNKTVFGLSYFYPLRSNSISSRFSVYIITEGAYRQP